MLGISLVLLTALEGSCRVVCWLRDLLSESGITERALAEVNDDSLWIKDYFREFNEADYCEWHPYVYWRRKPYKGQWVNISGRGIRKTWDESQGRAEQRLRIFMFGGSTMWGTGARDEYTIASCVARSLTEKGVGVEVTNFGETGYVSMQELITLLGELERGNVPDMVVFYDGINDTFSAVQNREAGIPHNEENRREEFNSHIIGTRSVVRWMFSGLLRVSAAVFRRLSSGQENQHYDVDKLADDVIRHYRFVMNTAKDLGKVHGFQVLFYWQPTVFQKQHKSPREIASAEKGNYSEIGPFLETTYARIQNDGTLAADPSFRNISELFAQEAQPLFMDCWHLGERGNNLVGGYIAMDIYQMLEKEKGHH